MVRSWPKAAGSVSGKIHLVIEASSLNAFRCSSHSAGTWEYHLPVAGFEAWVEDEGLSVGYRSGAWTAAFSRLVKSVAGGADVTLTIAEARNQILECTGALTANINVIVPAVAWQWTVHNNTSGTFTLTVKTASGTGIAVLQGKRAILYGDGTNIVSATTDPTQSPVGQNQDIAYAPAITPDAALGERMTVDALTGNLAINAPTNPRKGGKLCFAFTQDVTGGRTITWNAAFKKAADGGGTANQKGATEFVCDGANWVQVGGALAWAS